MSADLLVVLIHSMSNGKIQELSVWGVFSKSTYSQLRSQVLSSIICLFGNCNCCLVLGLAGETDFKCTEPVGIWRFLYLLMKAKR